MLPFCTFYCNENTLKKFVLIPILFAVFLFLFLAVIIMRSLAVVQDEMRWIFLDDGGVRGTFDETFDCFSVILYNLLS